MSIRSVATWGFWCIEFILCAIHPAPYLEYYWPDDWQAYLIGGGGDISNQVVYYTMERCVCAVMLLRCVHVWWYIQGAVGAQSVALEATYYHQDIHTLHLLHSLDASQVSLKIAMRAQPMRLVTLGALNALLPAIYLFRVAEGPDATSGPVLEQVWLQIAQVIPLLLKNFQFKMIYRTSLLFVSGRI
jgi:hypothetical protein